MTRVRADRVRNIRGAMGRKCKYTAMNKALGPVFEKAVHILVSQRPVSDTDDRKPALFHDIRVGVYLYENSYSSDVILAGLLHDAVEWYGISEQTLREEFGDAVTDIVVACTKDDTIKDSQEKIEKIIKQCVAAGEDALIVKTADILDSYKWYTSTQNEKELLYCARNIETIFRLKPDAMRDKIFDELRKCGVI